MGLFSKSTNRQPTLRGFNFICWVRPNWEELTPLVLKLPQVESFGSCTIDSLVPRISRVQIEGECEIQRVDQSREPGRIHVFPFGGNHGSWSYSALNTFGEKLLFPFDVQGELLPRREEWEKSQASERCNLSLGQEGLFLGRTPGNGRKLVSVSLREFVRYVFQLTIGIQKVEEKPGDIGAEIELGAYPHDASFLLLQRGEYFKDDESRISGFVQAHASESTFIFRHKLIEFFVEVAPSYHSEQPMFSWWLDRSRSVQQE